MYIEMASYEKIYDLKAEHELPERIFLDKGNSYAFSVFLTVREHSFEFQPERGLWARLEWSPWGGARAAVGAAGEARGRGLGAGHRPTLAALTRAGACSAHHLRAAQQSGSGRGAGRPGLHRGGGEAEGPH